MAIKKYQHSLTNEKTEIQATSNQRVDFFLTAIFKEDKVMDINDDSKVRKERNVCVVVVVALSWYRALLTSSVQ